MRTVFEIDEPIEQKVLDPSSWHLTFPMPRFQFPGAAPQVTNDVLSGPATAQIFSPGAPRRGYSIGELCASARKDLRPDADVDAEMAHVLELCAVHDTIKTPRQSIGGLLSGQARRSLPQLQSQIAPMGSTQT